MSTLERAIAIAADAHAGQANHGGEPYILHPLRVMLAMSTEVGRIVGVLHDVVEGRWSLERIGTCGFATEVIEPLRLLTRECGTEYADYIAAIVRSGSAVAREVKIRDVLDNMRRERLQRLPPAVRTELETRYLAALLVLDPDADPTIHMLARKGRS